MRMSITADCRAERRRGLPFLPLAPSRIVHGIIGSKHAYADKPAHADGAGGDAHESAQGIASVHIEGDRASEGARPHDGPSAPLTLFWTASGIELNATGSELWMDVEADYRTYEPWISVLINGAPVARQMVTAGRRRICVFRGMNPDAVKNVRIVKDTQAMSADPGCVLHIHGVESDGDFLPVRARPVQDRVHRRQHHVGRRRDRREGRDRLDSDVVQRGAELHRPDGGRP